MRLVVKFYDIVILLPEIPYPRWDDMCRVDHEAVTNKYNSKKLKPL